MDPQILIILLSREGIIQTVPDLLGQQIRPAVCHRIKTYKGSSGIRRLTMVTSYQPIPTVIESVLKGIKGSTMDAATRRVVDGVCGHRHGEVLMGV